MALLTSSLSQLWLVDCAARVTASAVFNSESQHVWQRLQYALHRFSLSVSRCTCQEVTIAHGGQYISAVPKKTLICEVFEAESLHS